MEYCYIDLIEKASAFEASGTWWVIGAGNQSDESHAEALRYLTLGTSVEPVEVREPNLVDTFLSILDSRRLKRTWQNSWFIAMSNPQSLDLARAIKENEPIRFLTSTPSSFRMFKGEFRMLNADLFENTSFLSDVNGIPLSMEVLLENTNFRFQCVSIVESNGSRMEASCIVIAEGATSIPDLNVGELFYRKEVLGTFHRC